MAKTVTLDFDELTNRELELIEEHSGITLAEFGQLMKSGDTAKMPYSLVTVLTFLALKRTKPDADLDEVLDARPGDFELELKDAGGGPLSSNDEPPGSTD